MIDRSYTAHELLCLYAEISPYHIVKHAKDVLQNITSFETYIKKIIDGVTHSFEFSVDVLQFRSKIAILAMKLREAIIVRKM
jgi:hypothetical protein